MNELLNAELTLHFLPSPYGIDWSTPKSLALTAIRNQLTKLPRKIGHVTVEVKYPAKSHDPELYFHTGMAAERLNSAELILKKHLGLGILFHNFEGRIESSNELNDELSKRYQTMPTSFITYKITKETAYRLKKYLDEYLSFGDHKNYGLPNRPLFGEGAGCSAFATSFLEVAGILSEEHFKAWSHTLFIPEKFIGDLQAGKKVYLPKLLSPLTPISWGKNEEAHRKLFFWDPDLMYRYGLRKAEEAKRFGGEISHKDKVSGAVLSGKINNYPEKWWKVKR